eukprot:TRINITY_DN3797_c0_g1_i2.p1 TRINITY_DN3797_c0_g1~~TRINITY_DN3797_c0_g1_i2.p1  ORF type:complete len:340 (+),score=42.89 TRINITY_DN3797_c0_g1_i2:292-1311(+)
MRMQLADTVTAAQRRFVRLASVSSTILPKRPSGFGVVVVVFVAIGCVFWFSRRNNQPQSQGHVDEPNIEVPHGGGHLDEEARPEEDESDSEVEWDWESKRPKPAVEAPMIVTSHSAAIILLHGLGDEPQGGLQKMFEGSMNQGGGLEHVKWIIPGAPTRPVTWNRGHASAAWFDVPALGPPLTEDGPVSTEEEVFNAVRSVHSLIATCQAEGIPASRILVAGFSLGGATTLVSVLAFRERLAGAIVMWGWLPLAREVMLARTEEGGRQTPLCWSHARGDPSVPFQPAEKASQWIRDKLHVHCEFHAHQIVVHNSHEAEYNIMHSWIRKHLPPLGVKPEP